MRRRRPASYRAIVDIAVPTMLGSLAQSAIYLTDSVFVGRLSEVPLAAIGLGGLLVYPKKVVANTARCPSVAIMNLQAYCECAMLCSLSTARP